MNKEDIIKQQRERNEAIQEEEAAYREEQVKEQLDFEKNEQEQYEKRQKEIQQTKEASETVEAELDEIEEEIEVQNLEEEIEPEAKIEEVEKEVNDEPLTGYNPDNGESFFEYLNKKADEYHEKNGLKKESEKALERRAETMAVESEFEL